MADLTAPRKYQFVGMPEETEPKLTASVTYYEGSILVLKPATGYAAKPTDTANEEVAGIVTGAYENGVRDDAYAMGTTQLRCRLIKGKTWVPVSGAAQTDVGVIHYVADDSTMTKTAGSKTVGYRALDFKTGYLLFNFAMPDRIA